ncbi:MAG: ribonuclease Z [Lachnospiraceae bacterium]|nr:ribonuclease Z [Lachnospiraceae bacterium]
MLDVCLLGTGGMMPLPYRWLTALMMRYNGSSILIDCGEGTQIAMKEKGWSPKPIDVMCFTHFHADHISGLPGMLLSMGNSEKTSPLLIIGPKGLTKTVNSLRAIAPELPFEIEFKEIKDEEEEIQLDGYRLKAFKVKHNVICYGYSICIDRIGKFSVDRAKEAGIPVQMWNPLQKGNTVEYNGKIFTPEMVLGPQRKGIKLTYCTDSRPADLIVENAKDSDLFICEGMYAEPGMEQKAKEHKHMTFYEAAKMAKKAKVKEMWLTHYSPSLSYPGNYEKAVKEVFPNTVVAKDGRSTELDFED